MNNSTPSRARRKADQRWSSENNNRQEPEKSLTYEDLYHYLYKINEIKALNLEEITQQDTGKQDTGKQATEIFWCDVCQDESIAVCKTHGTEHSKPQSTTDTAKEHKLSSAIASFPDEVQLCRSSIPGSKYGVITKCHIPKGTWLGPYEGTKVRPEVVTLGTDATYMWEVGSGPGMVWREDGGCRVYHRGKLSHYLDGSDEDSSSWMRFISCARNSTEQNMYAFQYCGNIYYRAFKEIPPGTELLVWYDDIYPQFMGIPLEIRETEGIYQRAGGPSKKDNEVVVVVPPHIHEPCTLQDKPTAHAPLANPASSCINSSQLPTVSVVNSDPRTSHRASAGFNPEDLPTNGRTSLSWQQPGYIVTSTGSVSHSEPRATSELLNRRRKRASLGRAEVPWQHTANVPTSPGSELLLKRPKSGVDVTGRQPRHYPSTSSATPGSLVETRLLEQNVAFGMTESDPYNLQIQIESSSGPNLLLRNPSSSNNERPGSSSSSADHETRKKPEEINDDNAFQCGQCGKTFPQRSVLQIHVCPKAPYKPYHCGHCSQLFSDPNELRNHAIIHINEKPFKCGYCSRSFSGATTLNNHIRTHTGEKPFECSLCGKTFSQASQLSRHEKIPGDCV